MSNFLSNLFKGRRAADIDTPSRPYGGLEVLFYNYTDNANPYGESTDVSLIPIGRGDDKYVAWGLDDQLPYHVMRLIAEDEVMSGNKLFNVLTCYGSGVRWADRDSGLQTEAPEPRAFFERNALRKFALEQITDMKFFYMSVAVIYLNRAGDKVVRLRHKEACYTRFAQAGIDGRVPAVFFADFEHRTASPDDVERVTLLDETDPLGHLLILMGREAGPDGKRRVRTSERKFAIVCKFPTVGNRYYPIPYYSSLFRGNWYEIKRLIGIGKRIKLRNHCGLRYLVEINDEYWKRLYAQERIVDEVAKARRQREAKEEITRFLSGIENSGKALYSGFYKNPAGEEVSMIKITPLDTRAEGGDWASDLEEASNVLCFADNVHPNLVGATPGKGGQNNSGSDKRELFTLKQSLETAFHDILEQPHRVVIGFNNWDSMVRVETPLITLTTLDKHRDAQESVINN